MRVISDATFLQNVRKCLTITHLSDMPMPLVVIKGRLYTSITDEQIYGIMRLDGTPLSVEDRNFKSKKTNIIDSFGFNDKVARLHRQVKAIVLEIAGESPSSSTNYTAQEYKDLLDSLFGPGGFFLSPKPLTPTDAAMLRDLFKDVINRTKGTQI